MFELDCIFWFDWLLKTYERVKCLEMSNWYDKKKNKKKELIEKEKFIAALKFKLENRHLSTYFKMPVCICIPESVRENLPTLCENWDPNERRNFLASSLSGVLVS